MRKDRVFSLSIWCASALVLTAYLFLIGNIVQQSSSDFKFDFLLLNPSDSGRSGGILSVLVSTILILIVTIGVATPIGIATAILLAEFSRQSKRMGTLVRFSLDVLAAVPSVVFGLFGNALFCKRLGLGFSIISGGLTLALMVLPLLIRTTEMSLRSVPIEFRVSGSALALSRHSILFNLVLPSAIPGLVAGLILGIGRALAETAALIFTSGYVDRMPGSLWDSGRALSIHIYDLSMNVPGGEQNAYKAAITLIFVILFANSLATIVTNYWFKRKITL